MHKQLNIPIIDAHAHIMSTERIYSGMLWLKKMSLKQRQILI